MGCKTQPTNIVLKDQFVANHKQQVFKVACLPHQTQKSNQFHNGFICYFTIVSYIEICKWQIKSLCTLKSRLRICGIMLPSSDFAVAHRVIHGVYWDVYCFYLKQNEMRTDLMFHIVITFILNLMARQSF